MQGINRTRKWVYVSQEARRLADLGLRPREIADRLGLDQSTVNRWMIAGKLPDTRESSTSRPLVPVRSAPPPRPVRPTSDPREKPEVPSPPPLPVATAWGASVRASYQLNPTDAELVRLAEAALTIAQTTSELVSVRLSAMSRFQALVKQLALLPRDVDAPVASPPPVIEAPSPPRLDPRVLLQ